MQITEILTLFDEYLEYRGLRLDAVIMGCDDLDLSVFVSRFPQEFDILYPELSKGIVEASRKFAIEAQKKGKVLQDLWLHGGSQSLTEHLQPQWRERLHTVFGGTSIRLRSLDQADRLCAKLFRLCDSGVDLSGCLEIVTTAEELANIRPWLEEQRANPFWTEHVRTIFAFLEMKLGHLV